MIDCRRTPSAFMTPGRNAGLGMALAMVLGMASTAASAKTTRPPNVILVVADDLGVGDVGVYGGKVARTPNIDALAAGGVRLTDGHVAAPVCSPSRVALLSGRYQERYGYEFNPMRPGVETLPLDQKTLADRMSERGYITGRSGKWPLGWRPEQRPDKRGCGSYFGLASGNRYFPTDFPGVERISITGDDAENPASGDARPKVVRDGQTVEINGNLTDAFTDEALAFIDRNRAKPFFLYLAYNAPHTPLEADAERFARFDSSIPRDQRVLAAMVATLDDGIGRISAHLKTRGLERDTLVIFISDNGCPLYLKGACNNAELLGGKRDLLQGGLRVPFILSWPGVLKPGLFKEPASTLDIAPTVLAAAGAPPTKDLEGVDLKPYLGGKKAGSPHDYIFWRASPSAAVRSGPWKLIRAKRADGAGFETFLFKVGDSQTETKDLAAANPSVVARLSKALDAWTATLPEPRFQGRQWTTDIAGKPMIQTF